MQLITKDTIVVNCLPRINSSQITTTAPTAVGNVVVTGEVPIKKEGV